MMVRAISLLRETGSRLPVVCFLLLTVVCAVVAQTGSQGTVVGTVKDATGAAVPGAKVTVVNTGTQFVSEGTTNTEGNYYIPYLNPGTYRITIVAAGFKQWIREGFELRPGGMPRFDADLEVGALTESVEVTGAAPLLNTETAMVSTAVPAVILMDISNAQKRIVREMYYLPGMIGNSTAGYHILGNNQRSIGYSMDGISAKWPGLGTFDQNDQVIQTVQDALEEVKVVSSGMPAEFGHAASGGMQLTYRSGTNQLHFSFEDRLIRSSFIQRSYFQQTPQNPFTYDEIEGTFGGPLYFPKLYDGRNKTFFMVAFAQHREDTFLQTLADVPTPEMLNGDVSFGGLGYPIYDPKSIRQVGGIWTSDVMAGNLVPKNRFDPAIAKFLSYTPWASPTPGQGLLTATGPTQNFLGSSENAIQRTRWDVKVDHQLSFAHKMFGRYSQAHHRAQAYPSVAITWELLDPRRFFQPTDLIQGVLSDTYILSPTRFNEMRLGYNRRANQNLAWGVNEDWASKLGIPGVPGTTIPQLNVGYGIRFGSPSYYVGEELTFQDNLTQILGTHNLKTGYEIVRSRYNAASSVAPSGSYNFGGTCLPSGGACTPNTGNSWASFLMGSVTSATFTQRFANWLPRWWMHALYLQDDWKVRPGLTVNLGLRWSYETPFHTKYNQQSNFNPGVVDSLTGLMGAETHPKGYLYKSDWNNFQPRVGLAWRFAPKLVFRANFGLMTMDVGSAGGVQAQNFEEYTGTYNIVQPTGDPRPQFFLSQGPGVPINYTLTANGTFDYVGSSYTSRNAAWLDPNLVSPYVMNWSAGFQYEFASNWLLEARYEGSAGVKSIGSWNANEIPLSITLGGNTALQNQVYSAQQAYKPWTNFGTVNLISNLNHSTYHSGTIRIERRWSNGFTLVAFDTYSKALNEQDGEGGGGITYYNRSLQKGVASYNRTLHSSLQATYELPFGRGKRWLNGGSVRNYIFGGWALSFNHTLDSGMPFSIGFSGSPYKYLTGTRIVPLTSVEAAVTPNWSVGPNRFPLTVPPQNPYLKSSSFAYPAAYTTGYLGRNVFTGPTLYFQGFALRKSVTFKERYKATIRLDGHNLPWKRPSFTTPNGTWTTAPGTSKYFGSMSSTMSTWSEYGYSQANVQLGIRFEF